jgi:hypothetical protein
MPTQTYLVFGDLHGRILPAFRLATVWARDHETPVAGLLQVGDLGYFPDLTRLDKATARFAKDDPTELGAQDIVTSNPLADSVFDDPDCAPGLWFAAGNHEDHDALVSLSQSSGPQPDFAVDAYSRVLSIRDGRVVPLADGPRVGALWGIDGDGPNCRKRLPERTYLTARSADRLGAEPVDVLLTHDAPLGAKRDGYGSGLISSVIQLARPQFAFFGHYNGKGTRIEGDFGATEVYHLGGFELGGRNGNAELGSVGALTWDEGSGRFAFLVEDWLRTFTRHNWMWR